MENVYPIMMAVCKGHIDMIDLIMQNPSVDVDKIDPKTGVNAFWLACLFGNGSIMKKLAEKGCNIMSTNKQEINVLHLAIYKD